MYTITSGFGRRYHPVLKTLRNHTGIDIAAPKGTPIYATADGTVSREKPGSGYGICVLLNHGYSYQTLYAHMSKMMRLVLSRIWLTEPGALAISGR